VTTGPNHPHTTAVPEPGGTTDDRAGHVTNPVASLMTWRTGTVTARRRDWPGARELTVRLDDPLPGGGATEVRALAYTALVGDPAPGDHLLLNVSALARGLGTGGYALVVGPAADATTALPADPAPGPGHLVKARYTPLQAMVLGVDEQESPHHDALRDADDLAGLPVVVADLHSALPAIVAGARHAAALDGRPAPRVAYVMTDGGALPAAFSRTVATLRDTGWIDTCITVGQAFGGDLEAVTVHTGLLAAHHVAHADLVVVAQGPGNLGTGTRWGFSGVACGEAVNAAVVLGGRPVGSLRISEADARERHHGVSHHSLTAYGKVAMASADVVVPKLSGEFGEKVAAQAAKLPPRHHVVTAPVDGLDDALRACPVRLSTMGRSLDEDHAYFLAAAAAGRHASTLLSHDS
jgi:hypothetical protein